METNHRIMSKTHFRIIIASAVGIVLGLLAFFFITLPTLSLLAQFSQYASITRLSLIIKIFSPVICLFLGAGWVWGFFLIHDLLIALRNQRTSPSQAAEPPQIKDISSYVDTSHQRLKVQRIAVPSLFQLDPTNPAAIESLDALALPITPIPNINPDWSPEQPQPHISRQLEKETVRTPDTSTPQEQEQEQVQPAIITESPSSEKKDITSEQSSLIDFTFNSSDNLAKPETPINIFLLKRVKVQFLTSNGTARDIKLRKGENSIRLILLAYVAWRKGGSVDRDKMITHVLARGRRRDSDTDKLNEVFDAAKKYLREDLKKAVQQMNAEAGKEVLSEKDVNFFSTEPGFYWLHQSCRVVDLEEIEQYHQSIRMARKDGLLDEKLDGSLPEWIIEACQKLITTYPGDFLEELLGKFPEEFGPWMREPFTLYRDMYLDALWILAGYERALGQNFSDEQLSSAQNEEQRRHHITRASQIYFDYASYAIKSRFDSKLKFKHRSDKDGERVIMSERAIRRSIVELGKLGKTDMIDQTYLSYKDKMASLSEGQWKPKPETENDVAEAKRQTNAYRFSAQVVNNSEQKQA